MSGLEWNKIAAAVLLAGIIGMVTGYVADALYHPVEEPATRGYKIAGAEEMMDGAAPQVQKEEKPVDILAFMAEADAAAGEALKRKCAACHGFEKGSPHKVGPALWNIMGTDIASADGYAYSDALKNLQGKWGFQEMSEFLRKPKDYAPGTKMAFIGFKKPEDRANMIAYLRSLSDNPIPVPAYTPPVEEPVAEEISDAENPPNAAVETGEEAGEKAAEDSAELQTEAEKTVGDKAAP